MTAEPLPSKSRGLVVTGVIILLLGAAGIILLSRAKAHGLTTEGAQRSEAVGAGPLVRTAVAAAATGKRDVVVQGDAQPWASVTLYAKVSGYLRSVAVDKGDHVTSGQKLAEIESPEIDKAYIAAQADAANKHALAKRDHDLLLKHFVSPEESESAETAAQIADAKLAELGMEQGYELLKAPFNGTVTARFADPGALVQNAATNQTSALPVLTIADIDTLRVRLFLDQQTASLARRGLPVEIRLPDRPGFAQHAQISRITEQLDPKTRMLLAEADVDNRDRKLLAGSFVEVHIAIPAPAAVSMPAEAVLSKGDKQFVAVVDSTNHVHFRPVTLGHTDGTHVDVLAGIAVGERVVLNLGDGVADGALVRTDRSAEGSK